MNFYPAFLLVTAAEILFEAAISARNSAVLKRSGAIDVAPGLLPIMAFLFAALYLGSAFEYSHSKSVVQPAWAVAFSLVFLGAKLLKFWAISALGRFWTMKVLILPGSRAVTGGPYRWIRHPNYVAVLMEICSIAGAGKSLVTGLSVLLLFCVVLAFRIRAEEAALRKHTDYYEQMRDRPRFLP